MTQSMGCSSRGPGFDSQHPCSLQLPVTPASEYLMPLLAYGAQTYM